MRTHKASDKLPYELDEAAIIDVAPPLQLFRLVYQALMMPSLVAVGIYALPRAAIYYAAKRYMVPGLTSGAFKS